MTETTTAFEAEDLPKDIEWLRRLQTLLTEPGLIEDVEQTAAEIRAAGVKHVIWAGMGGSVVGVQALASVLRNTPSGVELHVLDSTDPEAVDDLLGHLCEDQHETGSGTHGPSIEHVLLIAVAMSRTSQEPVEHIRWFERLATREGRPIGDHVRILTVAGSFLEHVGRECDIPVQYVFPANADELPGRMSTPASRAFLLALALLLPASAPDLRQVLKDAWKRHNLDGLIRDPARNQFVQLAATLNSAARDGSVCLFLSLPGEWSAMTRFVEMLLEQSLGKQQTGIVVFDRSTVGEIPLTTQWWQGVTVRIGAAASCDSCDFVLDAPGLDSADVSRRLSAFLGQVLGWQVVTAVLGHLRGIDVMTEPAVEHYKRRAQFLRQQYALERASAGLPIETLPAVRPGVPILLDSMKRPHRIDLEFLIASSLATLNRDSKLRYLDVTVNGRLTAVDRALLIRAVRELACGALGVPFKVREAPAEYHVSEQAQMDGPDGVVSIRVVGLHTHQAVRASIDGSALTAAAIATWEAMVDEAGRCCFLLVFACPTSEAARTTASLLATTAELADHGKMTIANLSRKFRTPTTAFDL